MKYRLVINDEPNGKPLLFSYGNTKRIELKVSSMGAIATCELKRDYRSQLPDCYLGNLIKEAMKRASLVYLLRYQKSLVIRSLRLEVKTSADSIEEAIDLQNEFTLYSMITGRLKRPISSVWKQRDILQRILTYQKSNENMSREISALYAYLFSKTKTLETERFSYLWMAMNGFFASYDPANNGKDRAQLETFVRSVNPSFDVFTRDDRDKPCKMTAFFLKSLSAPVTIESIDEDAEDSFAEYISDHIPTKKDGSKYHVSLYTLLLTDFPYYLRCRMFHANKPIELFSFTDDYELNALCITNGIMEDFLDSNLTKIFQKTPS